MEAKTQFGTYINFVVLEDELLQNNYKNQSKLWVHEVWALVLVCMWNNTVGHYLVYFSKSKCKIFLVFIYLKSSITTRKNVSLTLPPLNNPHPPPSSPVCNSLRSGLPVHVVTLFFYVWCKSFSRKLLQISVQSMSFTISLSM